MIGRTATTTGRRAPSIGALVLIAAVMAPAAGAQAAPGAGGAGPITGSTCDYARCALGIAPRWNGLAVVRGGERIANLNFFWPRDISVPLRGGDISAPGADSAAAMARHAVGIRRVGAALTDAGIALAATAAVRALGAGRLRRSDGVIAGAAIASLGLSVPFQFAADGALSRAVWWHNLRYGR